MCTAKVHHVVGNMEFTSWLSLSVAHGIFFFFIASCSISHTFGATTKPSKTSVGLKETNTKQRNTVMHANLANAGKKAGLEIWRIEVSTYFSYVFYLL